jgi:hypothetical protein
MKSIQQVLWRGALALGLMAVGLGSGLGMPPAERSASPAGCPLPARALASDQPADGQAGQGEVAVFVLRRPLNPAG